MPDRQTPSKLPRTAVLLLIAGWLLLPVRHVSYVVSMNGSDRNDGVTAPWKSLQKGIDALRAGDMLYVLAGQYSLDAPLLVHGKKGTRQAPIAILALGSVILSEGEEKAHRWQGMIDLRDSNWITVSGFSLENSAYFGIYMESTNYITIEKCRTNRTASSGVAAWRSSHVVIRDCDIRAACNKGDLIPGGCQENISLDHVQGFLIENNKVHDSQQSGRAQWGGGEGIDVKNGTSNGIVRNNEVWNLVEVGIYVDGWEADIKDVDIHGNRVHNCANGIALNSERGGSLSNVRVHDNVSESNGFSGIAIWRFRDTALRDIQIRRNTVTGNGMAAAKPYFLPASEKVDGGIGVEIRNPRITGLTIRDNTIYGNASGQLVLVEGIRDAVVKHNLLADPSFTSRAAGPATP